MRSSQRKDFILSVMLSLSKRWIRVKSPSAKSPPGKVNASQIIAHQLNAVWSQVAASRYERHYDADKCIIVRRKQLYYAVVTSKYILEVHLPWICVIKCQRGGNRRVVFTKRTQSYRYRAESTTFCTNRWSHNKIAISVTDNIAERGNNFCADGDDDEPYQKYRANKEVECYYV